MATCLSGALAEAGVQLAWDASTSSNVEGYHLSYGTTSGQYTTTIDVGNVTTFAFLEPDPSVRYFLAVRAYDTDGLVSAYSNEISTTPAQPILRVTGISSSHTSPQVTGTRITFSAIATGGTAPVQFKWLITNGTTTQVGQTWSTNASFAWTPSTAGSYTIGTWARNAGSTADAPANPAAAMGMPIVINTSPNAAPTVSAGPDRIITLPSTASLQGSASDDGKPSPPGAMILSWTRVSGPGTVIFSAPAAAVTSASFSAAGTYVLRLTASDSVLSASDTVTVTVNAAATNAAPTVSAGPDRIITLPSTASLQGSASDDGKPSPPGAMILSWTRVSGPGTVIFSAPAAAVTSASFSAAGTYVLRLTASDSVLSASDTVTVTVNAAATNAAPTVSAGPDRIITLPSTASLQGSASDDGKPSPPGAMILSWTRVSGPGTVIFSAPAAAVTSASFSAAGTYVLRLTASDSVLSASDTVTVTVNAAATNAAPTVSAGPDRIITLPSTASLQGSASDDGKPSPPGAMILSWTRVSGPGTVIFSAPAAAVTSASFSAAGTYVLRLTASDSVLSTSDTVTVTVNAATTNAKPTVSAGPDRTIPLPSTVSLQGSASDDGKPSPPGAMTLRWAKISGPGAVTFSAPAAAVTGARFSLPGTYVLQLTASDSVLSASDSVTVTVYSVSDLPP